MDVNVRRSFGWLLALLVGLFASVAARAQSGNTAGDITFNKDIVPILQRSCQDCHRPDRRRPDVAHHLRRSETVGARDQGTHTLGPARRSDAAVVCREKHRHPEVQGRPVAERRGNGEDHEVGGQRRAARQSRRHAAAARKFDDDDKWTIGEPDLVLKSKEVTVPATGPDWWGDIGPDSDRPHRRPLRVGRRGERGQRRPARAAPPRPSADVSSSTT